MSRTLLDMQFDGTTVYNSASTALATTTVGAAIKSAGDGFELAASSRVKVARASELDALDTFTVATRLTPTASGRHQVILESQSPPMRIVLTRTSVVNAGVNTAQGWEELSSRTRIPKDKETLVRMSRDTKGVLRLEVGGRQVAEKTVGPLVAVGRGGLSVGADSRGANGYVGVINGLTISDTAITIASEKALVNKASQLQAQLKGLYGVNVLVSLDPATVDTRFNEIKSVMHAAGVNDLSSLATLRIDRPTKITRGTILKAPAQPAVAVVNWVAVAKDVAAAAKTSPMQARKLVDNALLTRAVTGGTAAPTGTLPTVRRNPLVPLSGAAREPLSQPDIVVTPVLGTPSVITAQPIRLGAVGPSANDSRDIQHIDLDTRERISAVEALERLKRDRPWEWPVMDVVEPEPQQVSSHVLPVNSAVIIARRLDLTNQTLEIDPAVGTLYIICEEIDAAKGAKITWKRPILAVPNIGDNPALDGYPDWIGVNTDGSKHGLPGGDAQGGASGLRGRPGFSAPNVEMWVLRMNGMPDIDLEGQDGGKGGRGQRGGRGGRGAEGEAGKWWWFFGKRCWSDPGDGGNGGDGGDGGRGGPGNRGGDGGDILFAVLETSLKTLTTTNAFTPDLGGGRAGTGGAGGFGGQGGLGGPRGYSEVCDGGHDGAQGQPGATGTLGSAGKAGAGGKVRIMTITQESWDEQLTRPWLYDVTPDATLPNQTVVLKGSRFADTDQVRIGTRVLASTLRPDQGLDVKVPADIGGGTHQLYLRRHDGQQSNRLPLIVKPQITSAMPSVIPGADTTVDGRAFLPGATVDYAGSLYPANVGSPTRLVFRVPETATKNSPEAKVSLTVINPDGQRSNTVNTTVPHVLKNGFLLGVHDYSFANDSDGRPSWATFEETYGGVEVWHELLDPIFGHPVLTTAFYYFYREFLKGKANGGLATGFCTALASQAVDLFWRGKNDTFATVVRDDAFRKAMTAIHGRLLTRECLVDFHEQGRRGQANVVTSFQRIEANFATGGTRETAPLLFFVPQGAAWDSGYFDRLADSHCIVPIRITYPAGYDGSSLDGVHMQCWDNNHPKNSQCYVDFRTVGSETRFTYTANGVTKFTSEDGITLATSTLGEYLLRDLDLPFSGPFGVTRFVFEFLLSPATLQVTDELGRITGQSGSQILSDIPGSHPAYLCPNAFLLPRATGLSRRITGTATGAYTYASLAPEDTSIALMNVATNIGESDSLLVNADATRVRFTPAVPKSAPMTLARRISGHARAISIEDFPATPANDLDVTTSPDMSLIRMTNTGPPTQVSVKLLDFNIATKARKSLAQMAIPVPSGHDLVVAVTSWPDLSESNVTTAAVPPD